jgi:hypothetical protein
MPLFLFNIKHSANLFLTFRIRTNGFRCGNGTVANFFFLNREDNSLLSASDANRGVIIQTKPIIPRKLGYVLGFSFLDL